MSDEIDTRPLFAVRGASTGIFGVHAKTRDDAYDIVSCHEEVLAIGGINQLTEPLRDDRGNIIHCRVCRKIIWKDDTRVRRPGDILEHVKCAEAKK